MREEALQIEMPNGVADAWLYAPDGDGSWPSVLHYPHGLGVDPPFHGMARRLAAEGYLVLLPNIFYRTTAGPAFEWPVDFRNPKTRERFAELSAPLTPEAMEADAVAYVDVLARRRETTARIGVVGYCLTGRMAIRTAAAAPDRIAAAASFHGGGLYTGDAASPHFVLPRVKARLYFGHAMDDRTMPADAIAMFETALADWGGDYQSETYPARHGWTVPGGEAYDPVQAERHYSALINLYAETLT